MYVARQRRGMGAALAPISQRDISNCSSGWYWLLPTCWAYSQSAWQQMGELPTPPVPAPPGAPSTVQEETQPGAFTPDQAIAESAAATKAQNQAFFQNVPTLLDSTTGTGLSTTAMIALGLAAGVGLLMLTGSSGGRRRR